MRSLAQRWRASYYAWLGEKDLAIEWFGIVPELCLA